MATGMTVPALKRRVDELERQLAELTKRFEEYVARPQHDPWRPIGPRPGTPPWPPEKPPWGTHPPDGGPVWPPTQRKLPRSLRPLTGQPGHLKFTSDE